MYSFENSPFADKKGLYGSTGGTERDPYKSLTENLGALGQYAYRPATQRAQFNAGEVEPQLQAFLRQYMQAVQNPNWGVRAQRAGQAAQAMYGAGQRRVDQSARAMGLGEGAQIAGLQGLSQMGTRAAAGAAEQYMDPARQQEQLAQAFALLSQHLQSNPYMEQMLPALQVMAERARAAREQRGGGLFGSLAGLAGGSLANWASQQAMGRR